MRTRLLALVATLAASLLLAACGDSDSGSESSGPLDVADGPAEIVPADAPIYFEAVLRPGGDQGEAIKDVVSKVTNGKVTDPGGEIIKAIESEAKSGTGPEIDFEDDIASWLGDSAGVFADKLSAEPEFAVAIESTDKGKAKDFVEKTSEPGDRKTDYKGTELLIDGDTAVAVTDDYLLIGDVNATKAALDVRPEDNLASNETFKKTAKAVSSSLAFGYISADGIEDAVKSANDASPDPPAIDRLPEPQATTVPGITRPQSTSPSGGPDLSDIPGLGDSARGSSSGLNSDEGAETLLKLLGDSKLESIGIGADVESDKVSLQFAGIGAETPTGDATGLIGDLPADSLLALGLGNIGEGGTKALDQIEDLDTTGEFQKGLEDFEREAGIDIEDDLLSWMGQGALFVRGSGASDVGGALVVETTDPAKTEDAIDDLKQVVRLAAGETNSSVRTSPITDPDVDEGFQVEAEGLDIPVQIAVKGDRFAIAIGNDALEDALAPTSKLGDTDTYKQAAGLLENGAKPILFVDIPGIVSVVDNVAGDSQEFTEIKPYLDAFGALVAGTRNADGSSVTQIAVGIQD